MYTNIVLIPYRERKAHLKYFLENSWPLIKKEVKNVKLVIIEQEDGKLFNRGHLLNIGFKEYSNKTKYFITQDVDVNPLESIIHLYNKEFNENHIEGIYNSFWITLGGIFKINSYDINNINGFPNNYWGWGCEDRALYNRSVFYNKEIKFNIKSNNKDIKKYFNIFNDCHDRKKDTNFNTKTNFEYKKFEKLTKKEQENFIKQSGLNNLTYEILERHELIENVEIIKVRI